MTNVARAFLLCIALAESFLLRPPSLMRPRTAPLIRMSLTKVTLHFDFDGIPFLQGMRHIHTPEHIATTHRLGAPFFHLKRVDPPRCTENRTSITFTCGTLVTPEMRIRMYTSRPNESNLLFFKQGRALYGARFSVFPTKAFTSHRLQLDITFFTGHPVLQNALKTLTPVFLLVNALEDRFVYRLPETHVNREFEAYRHAVLHGHKKTDDELLLLAQEVLRAYTA